MAIYHVHGNRSLVERSMAEIYIQQAEGIRAETSYPILSLQFGDRDEASFLYRGGFSVY